MHRKHRLPSQSSDKSSKGRRFSQSMLRRLEKVKADWALVYCAHNILNRSSYSISTARRPIHASSIRCKSDFLRREHLFSFGSRRRSIWRAARSASIGPFSTGINVVTFVRAPLRGRTAGRYHVTSVGARGARRRMGISASKQLRTW